MSKGSSNISRDKNRYKLPSPPQAIRDLIGVNQLPATSPDTCETALERINAVLARGCAARSQFVVESGRPCAESAGANAPVDLVIVIDTSGSMSDEASQLSTAADAAIAAAAASCPSDLRVAWFGIEGVWAGTNFTQSYRDYLTGLGVAAGDIVGTPGDLEDGAAAIMDLSDHYNWRPGASRAIFYLGDEALEGGDPQDANDVAAADSAIATAQARSVTVFTYAGTGISPATQAEYARVATETGGQAFVAPVANVGGFQAVLEQVICASAGGGCGPVEIPAIQPCFELQWGDGPDDHIETDDWELLCITASNPYSNVTFKGLTVLISVVTEANGSAVPVLPDGTPSVMVKPTYVMCFGDLLPCDANTPEKFTRVSREAVLISRGAKEGGYLVNIVYCYSIEFNFVDMDRFKIELVKS